MTTHEASDKWNIGESTVRKYCSDGLVEKCERGEGGRWIINDDALCPYVVRKNSANTQDQKMAHIYRSLNEEKTISPVNLGCDHARLNAYFAAMSRQNLIFKDENSRYEDPFRNYFINRNMLVQFKRFPGWKDLVNWITHLVPLGIELAPYVGELLKRQP